MSVSYGTAMATSGLVLCLDASNIKSYSGSGTSWYDLSGTKATGNLTNSPTYSSTSPASFTFNGSNTYVDCGNPTAFQLASAVTLEVWCNPTSSTGLGNLIQKNNNTGYRFRIDTGNLWVYSAGNSVMSSGAPCANGVWSHCVATFGPSGLTAYVNGNVVASNASAYAPSDVASLPVQIGCFSPGSETFNGKISVAKIYNKVLSAVEVQQNFNALRGRFGI